jgi:hypothetical protein
VLQKKFQTWRLRLLGDAADPTSHRSQGCSQRGGHAPSPCFLRSTPLFPLVLQSMYIVSAIADLPWIFHCLMYCCSLLLVLLLQDQHGARSAAEPW